MTDLTYLLPLEGPFPPGMTTHLLCCRAGTELVLVEGYSLFGTDVVGTGTDERRRKHAQGGVFSSLPDWKQELEGYEEAWKQDRSKESSVGAMDRLARAKEIMKGWAARNANLSTRPATVDEQEEPVPGPVVENMNQQHQTSQHLVREVQHEVQAQETQKHNNVTLETEEEEALQMQAWEAAQEARRQAKARHKQAPVGVKRAALVKVSRSHSPPAAVTANYPPPALQPPERKSASASAGLDVAVDVANPPPPAPQPPERKSALALSGLDRVLHLIKSRQRNSAALGGGHSAKTAPRVAHQDLNQTEESGSAKPSPAKPPPKPSSRRSRRLANYPNSRGRSFSSTLRSRNAAPSAPPQEGTTKYSKELAKYYSYKPQPAKELPPQFSGPMVLPPPPPPPSPVM